LKVVNLAKVPESNVPRLVEDHYARRNNRE
jgi:hypothetical protein